MACGLCDPAVRCPPSLVGFRAFPDMQNAVNPLIDLHLLPLHSRACTPTWPNSYLPPPGPSFLPLISYKHLHKLDPTLFSQQ